MVVLVANLEAEFVSKRGFSHAAYTVEQQKCLAGAELLGNGFDVLGSAKKYGIRLLYVAYVVGDGIGL